MFCFINVILIYFDLFLIYCGLFSFSAYQNVIHILLHILCIYIINFCLAILRLKMFDQESVDTVFRKRVMELLHQASSRAKARAKKDNRVYTSVSDLLTPGHKQARASSAVKRRATLMSNMVDNIQTAPSVSKKSRLQNAPGNSSATSSATPAVTSSATPSNTVEKKQKHRHKKSSHKHKKKYRLDSSDDLIVD